jgi:cell division protein ZapB
VTGATAGGGGGHESDAYNDRSATLPAPMSKIEELAERVERLLLRHVELQRTNALLEQQVAALTQERDSLRSRLTAARGRIDTLLERLPAETDSNDASRSAP